MKGKGKAADRILPQGFMWAHVWHRKADRGERIDSQRTIIAINSLAYSNMQEEIAGLEAQLKRLKAEIDQTYMQQERKLDAARSDFAIAKMFIRVLMRNTGGGGQGEGMSDPGDPWDMPSQG